MWFIYICGSCDGGKRGLCEPQKTYGGPIGGSCEPKNSHEPQSGPPCEPEKTHKPQMGPSCVFLGSCEPQKHMVDPFVVHVNHKIT